MISEHSGLHGFERKSGELVIEVPEVFTMDGEVADKILRELMERMPGATEALSALENDPKTSRDAIGEIIASGYGKDWAEGTKRNAGAYFRAWAQNAGVETKRSGGRKKKPADDGPGLFDELNVDE
jgi:hypothetical protein